MIQKMLDVQDALKDSLALIDYWIIYSIFFGKQQATVVLLDPCNILCKFLISSHGVHYLFVLEIAQLSLLGGFEPL